MALVQVDNRSTVAIDEDALAEQGGFMLEWLRLHPETELSISVVDIEEMAELNQRWMDELGPTDVLSFPMDELHLPSPGELAEPGLLGDVIICPQVAAAQAAQAGLGTHQELELLLTHGILHLLGHDHAEAEEHAVMFGLQDELLAAWRSRG